MRHSYKGKCHKNQPPEALLPRISPENQTTQRSSREWEPAAIRQYRETHTHIHNDSKANFPSIVQQIQRDSMTPCSNSPSKGAMSETRRKDRMAKDAFIINFNMFTCYAIARTIQWHRNIRCSRFSHSPKYFPKKYLRFPSEGHD